MSRPDASAKIAAAAPKNSNRALLAILVTAAIVAGIAVAVFVAVGSSRTSPTVTGAPKGATALGGPIVLNPDAPAGVPVLDLYEDPQCPACKMFEDYYGATVNDLVKTNKAKVRVHTLSFLDTNLKNDSSLRGANAAMCAADQGRFREYVSATYAAQPEVEGTGYTDAQLEAIATKVGVADLATWKTCQSGLTYKAHVQAVQVNATKDGVTGSPTVRLNGTDVKLTGNPQDLVAAIQAATK